MRKRRKLAAVLAILCSLTLMEVPRYEARAEDAIAATIRMAKTEGEVTVSDSTGKELKQTENMRLFNGNHIETEEKSYAYMNLDDKKAIKLDAVSEAEVRKNGKNFEVLLESGNLLFNVSEKLTDQETMTLRVSNMVMGIRGTGGILKQINKRHSRLILLTGSVTCKDSAGAKVELEAGQAIDFEDDEKTGEVNSTFSYVQENDIDGFALKELAEHKDFAKKASEESGVDFTKVKLSDAEKKLEKEQKEIKEKIDKVKENKTKQEDQNKKVKTPVWSDNPAPEPEPKEKSGQEKETPASDNKNNNNNNGNTTPNTQPQGGQGQGNQQAPENPVTPGTPAVDQTTPQTPTNQTPPADTGSGDSDNNESGNQDNGRDSGKNEPVKEPHDINLVYNEEGGYLDSNKDDAFKGESVKITAHVNDGYELASIKANHVKLHNEGNGIYKFKMPDKKVKVHAEFRQIAQPEPPPAPPVPENPDYTIETNIDPADAGDVQLNSPDIAKQGTRIEFTVKANGGYEIAEVAVHDETNDVDVAHDENEGLYSFMMPAGNVKIYAWFRESQDPVYYNIGSVIQSDAATVTFSTYEDAAGDLIEDEATQAEAGQFVIANIEFNDDYVGYGFTYVTGDGNTGDMAFDSSNGDTVRFSFTMPASDVRVGGICAQATTIEGGSVTQDSISGVGVAVIRDSEYLNENITLSGVTLVIWPGGALNPANGQDTTIDTTGGTFVAYGCHLPTTVTGSGTYINYYEFN